MLVHPYEYSLLTVPDGYNSSLRKKKKISAGEITEALNETSVSGEMSSQKFLIADGIVKGLSLSLALLSLLFKMTETSISKISEPLVRRGAVIARFCSRDYKQERIERKSREME